MSAKQLLGSDIVVLATSKQTLATPSTVAYDWGTPNDLYVPNLVGWNPGQRLVFAFTATTAGTTSTATLLVQDAPDSAGSIGAVATAVTDGTLAGGTGDAHLLVGLKLQAGPWVRVSLVHATATDSFVTAIMLLGIGAAL